MTSTVMDIFLELNAVKISSYILKVDRVYTHSQLKELLSTVTINLMTKKCCKYAIVAVLTTGMHKYV